MKIFESKKGIGVSSIVMIVIGVVVMFAVMGGLYSTFTTSVDDLNDTLAAQGTSTTSARTLSNMLKWIFPLGLAVAVLYLILKKTGISGGWG